MADTLSRASLPEREVHSCRVSDEFSQVSHTKALPVGEERWRELRQASSEDAVLCDPKKVIQEGWPQHKKTLPLHLQPYFDLRAEMIVEGELVFKGQQVVVPRCMRRKMIEKTH